MIKSPYNFVPLNENVFFPYWSKFVSQDVPFEDGLTGKLKLKITAENPIFIRGQEKEPIDSVPGTFKYHFCKLNGKYCIPGTSIKGELESVLENLGFAKLKLYNQDKFGFRDWFVNELYNKAQFADCYGGWLSADKGQYKIEYSTCKPGRIEFKEIDRIYKTDFVNVFGSEFDVESENTNEDDSENEKEKKSAKKKYDYLKRSEKSLDNLFSFSHESFRRKIYTIDENNEDYNSLLGTIVVTGQSSKRKTGNIKGNGKGLEFIFWADNTKTIPVESETMEKFFLSYFENDDKKQSIDWRFRKEELDNKKRIPVFFLMEKSGKKVEHLGLSMLYRLPYKFGISDLIIKNSDHEKKELDIIETIFGYVTKNGHENEASKGRVSIEPALITNNSIEAAEVILNLGSPKASFYPFYIWQNPGTNNDINGKYSTYNDENSKIAGRKRYPIQNSVWDQNIGTPTKTTTSFYPLPAGAEFETILHYHNLRPVELGAVLSSITFHNNNSICRHSLGMAKPFGYGKVDISIEYGDSDISQEESNEFMRTFQKVMTNKEKDWLDSEQLIELFCLSTPVNHNDYLTYPVLKNPINNQNEFADIKKNLPSEISGPFFPNNNQNEFADIKKNHQALPRYSIFAGLNFLNERHEFDISDFDVEEDKRKYFIDEAQINTHLEKYFESEKELLEQFLKTRIEIIKNVIKGGIKSKGISFLLEQTKIESLISVTNTWIGRYYLKTEQEKNIKNGIPAIPVEFQEGFLNHLTSLYQSRPKDRTWKIQKDILKYLKKCVGSEKANEWLKSHNLLK